MTLPLTLDRLKHWLQSPALPYLFLDLDGTLAPFTLNPADSRIPPTTLNLIKNLQCSGVPIAIITGRSLAEARQLLSPLVLPIGATHGLEIAFSPDSQPVVADFIPLKLPLIVGEVETQCNTSKLNRLFLEKKPYSVALHYRRYPTLAEEAEMIMQQVVQNYPSWHCKQGKYVWEIMPRGFDKGQAVTAILRYFQQAFGREYCPIFIGDDASDEAGFLAVQANKGIGIKVGMPLDMTHAKFFVSDIEAVSHVLQTILYYYQPHSYQSHSYQSHSYPPHD